MMDKKLNAKVLLVFAVNLPFAKLKGEKSSPSSKRAGRVGSSVSRLVTMATLLSILYL